MVFRSAPSQLRRRRAPNRGGFTLLELVVVMALVAVLAAAVGPSILLRAPAAPTLEHVIDAARSTAVSRAQSLRLVVATSGAWSLLLPLPDDTAIASGMVSGATPSGVVDLRLSPLGTCVAARPLPMSGWDAARCTFAATERR